MPDVTFIDAEGTPRSVHAIDGATLMQTAMANDVPGIDAECGGALACATCHVYVDEAWTGLIEPAGEMERDMLDFASDVRATSRLSCQIRMTPDLDGLVVRTPVRQG